MISYIRLFARLFPAWAGVSLERLNFFPAYLHKQVRFFFALAEVSLARTESADLSVHVLKIFARRR